MSEENNEMRIKELAIKYRNKVKCDLNVIETIIRIISAYSCKIDVLIACIDESPQAEHNMDTNNEFHVYNKNTGADDKRKISIPLNEIIQNTVSVLQKLCLIVSGISAVCSVAALVREKKHTLIYLLNTVCCVIMISAVVYFEMYRT